MSHGSGVGFLSQAPAGRQGISRERSFVLKAFTAPVQLIVAMRLRALRACLRIPRSAVFAQQVGWRGVKRENTRHGSSTEEQRSQPACCMKTLRAAGLLEWGFVVAGVTARRGDAPPASSRPIPKSLAAALLAILRQALKPSVVPTRPARSARCHSSVLTAKPERFSCGVRPSPAAAGGIGQTGFLFTTKSSAPNGLPFLSRFRLQNIRSPSAV